MSRHQVHRATKEQPGSFGPLFDWHEPEEVQTVGTSDPLAVLRAACLRHIEAGGLIARQLFGVSTVNRRRRDDRSPLTGTYKAENYCDPFGALLDGEPYGSGILPDTGRLLSVDEYWLAGFIHGLDRADLWVGRREEKLKESASYRAGRSAGRTIGDEFARIQVGWEG